MTPEPSDWSLGAIATYWDRVAARYLELFRDELQDKPFDQNALRALAGRLPEGAEVLDVGCGPCGHVARVLADEGLSVTGIDLSPECVALARAEHPALRFEVMDMTSMSYGAGVYDGLVAYYVLHYLPLAQLTDTIKEFARVLKDGGVLLLVAKEGQGEGWIEDPLGMAGPAFWSALPSEDLRDILMANGFTDVHVEVRKPLPQEIDVNRIYLTADRAT